MLREEAQYFSTRYDDVVREPDATWIDWVGGGAAGIDKALFVAEDDDGWLGVVEGSVGSTARRFSSSRSGSTHERAGGALRGR